jgi:organic radical activating enzyme
MSREEVVVELDALEQKDGPHSFVSLTGGEPLIHLPFLPFLLTDIKRTGYRTYLETAGVHPEALEEVISLCDVIAMDFKPSSVTGSKDYSEEHRRFLSLAKQKEVFVKLTLSESLDHDEYDRLIGIIAAVAPQTPVILQPLSGENGEDRAAEGLTLLSRLQRRALRVLPDVRIVPRLHKILNIP